MKKDNSVRRNNKIPIVLGALFMMACVVGLLVFWGDVLFGREAESVVSVSSSEQEVEVLPIPVSMSDSTVVIGKGLSRQLSASGGECILWSSSDENVASVDESGMLKGVSVGSCVVTAQNEDGSTAECDVTVKKTCYLTFDDGPNQNTEAILDVLKANDVHATFFVVSSKYLYLTQRMQEQGCLVGMHTYSHDYEICYHYYYSYFYGLDRLADKIES